MATLRHVYERRDEAQAKGREGARIAHSQWTWKDGCQQALPVLQALSATAGTWHLTA
jgi:hypothetical protein